MLADVPSKLRAAAATLALIAAATVTPAAATTYDIWWSGEGGYSLTGSLSHADALAGTGVIDETQIDDLSISVFLNGLLQGSRRLLTDGVGSFAGAFTVNFDTVARRFLAGGNTTSNTGQAWFTSSGGSSCDTVGFGSGSLAQGVCVGGVLQAASFVPIEAAIREGRLRVRLASTPTAPVPLPATALMMLSALGGLAVAARRKA